MKKILATILIATLAVNTARADSDDVWWAVGGFILGSIAADHNDDRRNREPQPERQPLPPPRRQPRMVPIYSTICQYRDQYDAWGHRLPPIRTCWQEITGYREVYDYE